MFVKPPSENGRTNPFSFEILGEPASKANSRRLVSFGKRPALIKSDKALAYSKYFLAQCPTLDPMFTQDVHVDLEIFYASRRPDLDESLILDLMQEKIYQNDRLVRSRTCRWGLDKKDPRTIISVRLMTEADYAA